MREKNEFDFSYPKRCVGGKYPGALRGEKKPMSNGLNLMYFFGARQRKPLTDINDTTFETPVCYGRGRVVDKFSEVGPVVDKKIINFTGHSFIL